MQSDRKQEGPSVELITPVDEPKSETLTVMKKERPVYKRSASANMIRKPVYHSYAFPTFDIPKDDKRNTLLPSPTRRINTFISVENKSYKDLSQFIVNDSRSDDGDRSQCKSTTIRTIRNTSMTTPDIPNKDDLIGDAVESEMTKIQQEEKKHVIMTVNTKQKDESPVKLSEKPKIEIDTKEIVNRTISHSKIESEKVEPKKVITIRTAQELKQDEQVIEEDKKALETIETSLNTTD